jgi:hypothetical protein
MSHLAYELNVAGARLARSVADEFEAADPDRPRFVAGVLGPLNRTASISPDVNDPAFRSIVFDELVAAYREAANGLLDGGGWQVPYPDGGDLAHRTALLVREVHSGALLSELACPVDAGRSRLAPLLAAPGLLADTPVVEGTWRQARAAARCAVAAALIAAAGDPPAYAVIRQPGHHAGPGFFGGYCYLNNAVVAASALQHARLRGISPRSSRWCSPAPVLSLSQRKR